MAGGTYCFESDTAIALTGAQMAFKINGYAVPMYETLYINRGDVLEAGYAQQGVYAYLAVLGGIEVESVLGSRSTYVRGRFGGVDGRPLKVGDQLAIRELSMPESLRLTSSAVAQIYQERVVHFTPATAIPADCIERFQKTSYCINPMSDRMGYRLDGEAIKREGGNDILSAPVGEGTIQVPGDGQPIVLLADRQTTGGYLQLGQIWQVDMAYFVQQQAGGVIRFEAGEVSEAMQQLKSHEVMLSEAYRSNGGRFENTACIRRFQIKVLENSFNVVVREIE
jgi:biotin-dependent carboxylase-like uncharacterized protein